VEVHDLDTWTDFRSVIDDIRSRYGFRLITEDDQEKNAVLFRGLGNHDWGLSTTLERTTDEKLTVDGYMVRASLVSNEIESVTGRVWGLPDVPDIWEETRLHQRQFHTHLPCYAFLVYLRQHGFPSPLLDWTTSPYVAAYFAFCDRHESERAAVYAFIEMPGGGKSGIDCAPRISQHGPYVTTDSRHFAQKSWYTTATLWDKEREKHVFCPHSDVFDLEAENQDILVKITIPTSERSRVLEELDDCNINHYTLFQTEDALVRALGIRGFDLPQT
jgi:FRG domain